MVQAFRETIADLRRGGGTTVFLSSHVLAEVESTCDRIGLVRGGRIVTTGTIDEIKRAATRRVTVVFRRDIGVPPRLPPDVTLHAATAGEWTVDVRGPLGALLELLGGLPVGDLKVQPFKLEDYIAQFYGEREMAEPPVLVEQGR